MTKEIIEQNVYKNLAKKFKCNSEDFCKKENVNIVDEDTDTCYMVSFGGNVVTYANDELKCIFAVCAFEEGAQIFEPINLTKFVKDLEEMGYKVFVREYFLPKEINEENYYVCKYETRIFGQKDLEQYLTKDWEKALDLKHKDKNVLGIGAFDNGNLIGLASCTKDYDNMYQIGVNVLEQYQGQNIGTTIVNELVKMLLDKNIVPYYCCSLSNIWSKNVAINSDLKVGYLEIAAKRV